jgi:hypothetical protein
MCVIFGGRVAIAVIERDRWFADVEREFAIGAFESAWNKLFGRRSGVPIACRLTDADYTPYGVLLES